MPTRSFAPQFDFNLLKPLAIWFALVLSFAGCGGSTPAISVEGHANYRGESLKNGVITFFPAVGRPISATIADDGTYQAQLEPGEYDVVLGLGTGVPKGYKIGDVIPQPKPGLPLEYTSRAKSKLKANIQPGQSEPINFDLK
jgi:hypothetical protein